MSGAPFSSKDALILARSLGISRQDASLNSDISTTSKRKQSANTSKQRKRSKTSAVQMHSNSDNAENEQHFENHQDEPDDANGEDDKYAENATMRLLLNPFQLHHALGYESDVSLSSADDADRLMPPPSRLPTHRNRNSVITISEGPLTQAPTFIRAADSIILQNARDQQMAAVMNEPTIISLSSASAAATLPLEPTEQMIQAANQQIMQHLISEKQRLINDQLARKKGTSPPSISPSILASSAMEHFHRLQREHTSRSRAERSQQNKRTLAAMMQKPPAAKIFAPIPPTDDEEVEVQQTPVRKHEKVNARRKQKQEEEEDEENEDEVEEEEEEEDETETPPRAQRSPKRKKPTALDATRTGVNKSSASSPSRTKLHPLANSLLESDDDASSSEG